MATKQIFVNLPVKNLKKSMEFFSKLGFSFNQQFTDDTAACMIVSDDIYVMLLTHLRDASDSSKIQNVHATGDLRHSQEYRGPGVFVVCQ